MMLDILLTNRAAVLAQLAAFQAHLAEIAALIEAEDEVALRHWLAARQFEYGIYRSHKAPRPPTTPEPRRLRGCRGPGFAYKLNAGRRRLPPVAQGLLMNVMLLHRSGRFV